MGVILSFFIFATIALSFFQTPWRVYSIVFAGLFAGMYMIIGKVAGNDRAMDGLVEFLRVSVLSVVYLIYILALLIISWRLHRLENMAESQKINKGVGLSVVIFIVSYIVGSV